MRRLAIPGALLLSVVTSGCIPLPRYPSVLPRSGPPPVQRLAERMDPWLLADGLADKVVVEFDWVEGCEPAPLTIEGLRTILLKYGPPGRPVEMRRSDAIPRSEWDEASRSHADDPVEPLVARHADPIPDSGIEHRYIFFAPASGSGYFGYSRSWDVEREGSHHRVSGVVVFRDAHARLAKLWISLDEIERMTLVHEFGHQLGLVADPRHERRHPHHRNHCSRLDCVMAHPTARLYWRNIYRGLFDVWFKDYCRECRAEIRTAQAEWRRLRAADPEWVARVRAKRDDDASVGLGSFYEARDWEGLLRESERRLADHPDSIDLRGARIDALGFLGRNEEALAEVRALPSDDASAWARYAWEPARTLIAAGRHGDALALLGRVMDARGVAPELDDYEYEQTSFVVAAALEGLGRIREAADLHMTLVARGSEISYSEYGMLASAANLYRRAGDLRHADAVLRKPLRAKRWTDPIVDAGFRLRLAQGRTQDAHRLLRKALEAPFRPQAWGMLLRARWLIALGRHEESRRALEQAEELSRRSTNPEVYGLYLAAIHAELGNPERVEELLRQRGESANFGYERACSDEFLEALRSDARYASYFAHCP